MSNHALHSAFFDLACSDWSVLDHVPEKGTTWRASITRSGSLNVSLVASGLGYWGEGLQAFFV